MIPERERIVTKAQLRDWLAYELPRYGVGGIQRLFPVSEHAILRKHQRLLRKTEFYSNSGRRLRSKIYKVRLQRMQNQYALHIPLNCCGRGLKIMHLGPILINRKSAIGKNCSIHINTALVADGLHDDAPVLGDGVVVGVGAVIVGGVTIANHVAIGANAVVNRDVLEEDIAVAGVPAHKVSDSGRSKWGGGEVR